MWCLRYSYRRVLIQEGQPNLLFHIAVIIEDCVKDSLEGSSGALGGGRKVILTVPSRLLSNIPFDV